MIVFSFSDPNAVAYDIAMLINKHLYKQFVTWPTEIEKQDIKVQFEEFTGFKNIIGAVDGTICKLLAQASIKQDTPPVNAYMQSIQPLCVILI